ncbi:methyltransferase [Saccharopolyspora spinosa]|uniref:methyltransferase n=1 Tax=Saccharopolyspora spinosa TaxID=60894 RepID=UPI00376EFFA8
MDASSEQMVTRLIEAHRQIANATTFRLLGLDWDLLPGVYAPHLTRSAALYAEWVRYPTGGCFCEIGAGTGYLAVLAALRGCRLVRATDINKAATDNIELNARRHAVADRLTAHCGDMFSPLPPGERYDTILWNSNFVPTTAETIAISDLEKAYDIDYQAHETFLRQAGERLKPGGRLLLGFTSLGDGRRVARLADAHGWTPAVRVPSATSRHPAG